MSAIHRRRCPTRQRSKAMLNDAGVVLGPNPQPRPGRPHGTAHAARGTSRLALTLAALAAAVAACGLFPVAHHPDFRARNATEAFTMWLLDRLLAGRGADHRRHRAVAVVRDAALLPAVPGGGFLLLDHLEPAVPRRVVAWHLAADLGHALCLARRPAGGGADRPDVGDLPGRIRQPPAPGPGSSRRSRSWPASRPSSTACSP